METSKPIEQIVVVDEGEALRHGSGHPAPKGAFCEIKDRFAREVITGFARIDSSTVGVVRHQPQAVFFRGELDEAARFIWLCDAFNVPLLFLAGNCRFS